MDDRYERKGGDSFWTVDCALCEAAIGPTTCQVRIKGHINHEHYTEPRAINPLFLPDGERIHLLMHPYLRQPEIALRLHHTPSPSANALGKSASFAVESVHDQWVGFGQAWYYPREYTLLMWELLPYESYRTEDVRTDTTIHAFWQGFERALLTLFPDTKQLITPSWEPAYDEAMWQQFLASLGFVPSIVDPQAFCKSRQ